MEIELGPFPKYEDVRYNAFWTRAHIDTRLRVDEDDIKTYKAHLQDCRENPTVGLLAGKKYITGKPMNYPTYARRNLRYLERQPEIDTLKKSLKNDIDKLYSKTKYAREYIVDNKRVVLDYVEKSKKYTTFDKMVIFFRRFL